MALTMCFASAAYVIVMAVKAAINYTQAFVNAYAFEYRGNSVWGNQLGLYELIAFILFAVWSLSTTIGAFYSMRRIMDMLQEKEIGVKKDGFGGVMLDDIQAMKFFTLEMLVGLTSVIAGYSMGNVADELVTFYDQYTDDVKKEGTNQFGNVDPNGTSAEIDYAYHWTTLAFGYLTFTMITGGGFYFMYNYLKWNDDIDCKLDDLSESVKAQVRSVMLANKTPQDCYDNLPAILKLLDFNKNGVLDRCEDASILYSVGNTKAYSIMYSHHVQHSLVNNRCDQVFNPIYE